MGLTVAITDRDAWVSAHVMHLANRDIRIVLSVAQSITVTGHADGGNSFVTTRWTC
ncbi:hypothetical protein [uncultured Tateyamaria sp.]|uniref:hypothetical protein n=1 Tax=Tateyamaria sp. 1078 TaxID=3417464 RepID=UPI002635CDD0|nr:hypothetical protein [uncultured Tateyamaria sp.]